MKKLLKYAVLTVLIFISANAPAMNSQHPPKYDEMSQEAFNQGDYEKALQSAIKYYNYKVNKVRNLPTSLKRPAEQRARKFLRNIKKSIRNTNT